MAAFPDWSILVNELVVDPFGMFFSVYNGIGSVQKNTKQVLTVTYRTEVTTPFFMGHGIGGKYITAIFKGALIVAPLQPSNL